MSSLTMNKNLKEKETKENKSRKKWKKIHEMKGINPDSQFLLKNEICWVNHS